MLTQASLTNPLDHTMTIYGVPAYPAPPDASLLAEPPTLVLALICMGTLAAFGLVKRARGSAKRSGTGASGMKIPAPQFGKPDVAPGEAAKRAA